MKSLLLPGIGAAVILALLVPRAVAAPAPDPDRAWTIENVLRTVPPLRHDAGGRLAMVTWPAFVHDASDRSFARGEPLDGEIYRHLAARGLTQRIPFKTQYVAMALAIQQAGAQVIIVEGDAGNGPGAEAPGMLHRLDDGFARPRGQRVFPCPPLTSGWSNAAERVRATLRTFQAAGVRIDAVWLDWETEPYPGRDQWLQARACSRCRAVFPPLVLVSHMTYAAHILRLRGDLFGHFIAGAIHDVYPDCSSSNWQTIYSSLRRPTPNWTGTHPFPPVDLGAFSAANPVVYGNDAFYRFHWRSAWNYPLDTQHMDRVTTRIMLGQISAHADNAGRLGPDRQMVPWVARYCPDDDDPAVPILSRERYREILRHVWLRGADTVQIFNPPRPRHPEIALEEVQDAVAIYDEMLAWRSFLEHGQVMNTAVSPVTCDAPFWSGRRLGHQALVRAFTEAAMPVQWVLEPWNDGRAITLSVPPAGQTWRLTRYDDRIEIDSRH